MMEEKIDRRILKTKERIRDVFIELLSEKPLKSITVKELTGRADINRATFYLHYNDVFDLLEQLEHEIIEQFEIICESFNQVFTDEEFVDVFVRLLEFIRDNNKLCSAHLALNGERGLCEKLVKTVTDRCFDRQQYTAYGFAFVLAGTGGVIYEWIFGGMNESSRTVAEQTLSIIKKIRG